MTSDLEKRLKRRTKQKKHSFRFLKTIRLIIAVVAALALVFILIKWIPKLDILNKKSDLDIETLIMNELKVGNYHHALKQIEKHHLTDLKSKLLDSLKVDLNFNYQVQKRTSNHYRSLVLRRDEPYYLSIKAFEDCYLYLFQLTSAGEWLELFPNPKYSVQPNPMEPGELRLPAGNGWFFIENIPGNETIYLLASRWRQEKLESILNNVVIKGEDQKQLLNYIDQQQQASQKYGGVVYKAFEFSHH